MQPFRKKDPEDGHEHEEDMDKLMRLDTEVMHTAIVNTGKIDSALCERFVDQYLVCRRRYGEYFIDFVSKTFVSAWKKDADKRMENSNRIFLLASEIYIANLLAATGECPEMDDLAKYFSCAAKQDREAR